MDSLGRRLRRGESVVSFVGYPGILLVVWIWGWNWELGFAQRGNDCI
jgi:hypothetical protein